MSRPGSPGVHAVAGSAAFLTLATFWLSTVGSALLGSPDHVLAVKTAIPAGLVVLVPALAVTGWSGLRLARGRQGGVIGAKRRRMPVIAANGLLVLVPCALFLAARARAGEVDATFHAVQGIELVAGTVNLALLGRSLRDGLRLRAGRLRAGMLPAPR